MFRVWFLYLYLFCVWKWNTIDRGVDFKYGCRQRRIVRKGWPWVQKLELSISALLSILEAFPWVHPAWKRVGSIGLTVTPPCVWISRINFSTLLWLLLVHCHIQLKAACSFWAAHFQGHQPLLLLLPLSYSGGGSMELTGRQGGRQVL